MEFGSFMLQYGVSGLAILLIGLYALINVIKWGKGIYEQREAFKKTYEDKGKKEKEDEERQTSRFNQTETRLVNLETRQGELRTSVANMQSQVNLLINASQLDIRSEILKSHDAYLAEGYISFEELELLEDKFKIYTEEKGNHGVHLLMNDLRDLYSRCHRLSFREEQNQQQLDK